MANGTIKKIANVRYMDISDSTPVNVNAKTGYVVTQDNFLCAIAKSAQVVCLPYFNSSIQYIALKDPNMSTVSGKKDIRVFYLA